MKTKLTPLLFAATLLLSGAHALQAAESLSLIPDSAQSLGEAGGRFANLDDATAVRVNPANIADAERPLLQLNTGLWHADIKFDSVNGASLRQQDSWVVPGSLYTVIPIIPGKLAWGMGVSTPYGLGADYNKNNPLKNQVPYESSFQAVSFTPAIGWRINDSISAGIGLDVMYGRLQINQLFPLGLPTDSDLRYDADGVGVSGYGGITWNITPHQRLALIGRLPLRLEMSGSFDIENAPPGVTTQNDFETNMTFPGSLALGYGIDVTDRLTLGLDFKWSANSSHDDIPLNTTSPQIPDRSFALNWKNSIDLGAGGSYKLNEAWKVRAGYLFSENSMPGNTFTPSIPAYDRHIFSVGLGWTGKNNRVDLSYGFIYNPTRTVTNAATAAFNGNYKHQWHVLMLSVGHYF